MSAGLDARHVRQAFGRAAATYEAHAVLQAEVGARLLERLDGDALTPARVLDVGSGPGRGAAALCTRFPDAGVVALDLALPMLRAAASHAGEPPTFARVGGDAQALPFADGSFDVVLSTFGVMFSPDQAQAASELARVCRSGGRIGLANWTPTGFIGELFKVLGRRLPPPAGVLPPSLWGVEGHLQSLFAGRAASIAANRRIFNFRYRSPAHFIDVFRTWYGPVHKAFLALSEADATALENDLTQLLGRLNRAGPTSLVVPSEYLEVVITRR